MAAVGGTLRPLLIIVRYFSHPDTKKGANSVARLYSLIAASIAALSFSVPASAASLSDDATAARADTLVAGAIALLPPSGPRRAIDQETIVSYYLETKRCDDALEILSGHEASQTENLERLAMAAHRTGLNDCTVELSRRWASKARQHKRSDALAKAGALLRLAGNVSEGLGIISEAESSVREPPTRTSYLWSIRSQTLQIYEGTDIFSTELERGARQLLAMPPGENVLIGQPTGGRFAAWLLEHGNSDLAKKVAESVCASARGQAISCGYSGYLDRDLERLSREIAKGTAAQQLSALHMLYRNGALDRVVPHFPRMVDIQGGNKIAAFRSLVFYSNTLWQSDPKAAEEGARQALALGLTKADKAGGLDASSWGVLHSQLARIFAGSADTRSIKETLHRGKPQGKERDHYYIAIASGFARFGDVAAVERNIEAISTEQAQREAWLGIAVGTPGVPMERRTVALERALALPEGPRPMGGHPSSCNQMAGGAMIASEGASAEAIIALGQINLSRGKDICGYRRYLLDAAAGTQGDERGTAIARELVKTTDKPCVDWPCDDLRILQLLVDLRLFDEAEQFAMGFEEADRIRPLIIVARGLFGSGRPQAAAPRQ